MDVEAGSSYQNSNNRMSAQFPGDHKIKELQSDVDEITNVMKSNINKVLERGDRVDALNERSELLSSHANEFRINSRNVRKKLWWDDFRMRILVGTVFLLILTIVLYFSLKQ